MVHTKLSRLLLFIMLLSLPSVLSLQISPGSIDLDYNPGQMQELELRVSEIGEEGIEVSASSSAIEFITDISVCKDHCVIKFKVTIPEETEPGKKEFRIAVQEKAPDWQGAAVGGVASVILPIRYIVPYPNKYVTVNAHTKEGKSKFQTGEQIPFVVDVRSYGRERVESIQGRLVITSEDGSPVTEIQLSSAGPLSYQESAQLRGLWQPDSNLGRGLYYYKAHVVYDGEEAEHGRALELGEPLVEVTSISPNTVSRGKIAKLVLNLKSHWSSSTETDVLAKLHGPDNAILSDSKSSRVDVPAYDVAQTDLFLDVSGVNPGKYQLELTTQFADDKTHTSSFELEVVESTDESVVTESSSGTLTIIVIVVVIIIVVAIFFIWKKKRDDDNDDEYESTDSF